MNYQELTIDYMQNLFNNQEISLVCNGKSLLSSNYSNIIDSANIVIRLNNGCFIYKNHIDQVGKKCDILCLNGYYRQVGIGSPQETFDNFKKDASDKIIFFTRPLEPMTENMKKNNLFVSQEYIEYLNNRYVFFTPASLLFNNNLTSGLVVILFLLKYTRFKKLRIFGMDFFKGSKIHYWDELEKVNKINHNSLFEEYLIKYIISKSNKVTMF
jgi:hypothetical protein